MYMKIRSKAYCSTHNGLSGFCCVNPFCGLVGSVVESLAFSCQGCEFVLHSSYSVREVVPSHHPIRGYMVFIAQSQWILYSSSHPLPAAHLHIATMEVFLNHTHKPSLSLLIAKVWQQYVDIQAINAGTVLVVVCMALRLIMSTDELRF